MKKIYVLLFALLLCTACSSGNSGGGEMSDSDRQGDRTDADTTDDSDSAPAPDTDKTEAPDIPEPASDADDTAPDSDTGTTDSDPSESGICSPNPCDTEENRAAHKSRCMPENNGTSYTCVCDASYYSSEGLCCQPHSSNKGGKCKCDANYRT